MDLPVEPAMERVGERRLVAATTATPADLQADRLEGALGLPGGRAGGQHVVAAPPPGPGRGGRRAAAAPAPGQVIEPARLAARRPHRARPGPRRPVAGGAAAGRSRRAPPRPADRDARDVTAQVGSWPRARTVARRDGTGTSTTGPAEPRRAADAASIAASGPTSPNSCAPSSPRTSSRGTPSYAAQAQGSTRPSGTGSGHASHASPGRSASARRAQRTAGLAAADAAAAEEQVGGSRREPVHDRCANLSAPGGIGDPARLWTSRRTPGL